MLGRKRHDWLIMKISESMKTEHLADLDNLGEIEWGVDFRVQVLACILSQSCLGKGLPCVNRNPQLYPLQTAYFGGEGAMSATGSSTSIKHR